MNLSDKVVFSFRKNGPFGEIKRGRIISLSRQARYVFVSSKVSFVYAYLESNF